MRIRDGNSPTYGDGDGGGSYTAYGNGNGKGFGDGFGNGSGDGYGSGYGNGGGDGYGFGFGDCCEVLLPQYGMTARSLPWAMLNARVERSYG